MHQAEPVELKAVRDHVKGRNEFQFWKIVNPFFTTMRWAKAFKIRWQTPIASQKPVMSGYFLIIFSRCSNALFLGGNHMEAYTFATQVEIFIKKMANGGFHEMRFALFQRRQRKQ